MIETNQDLYAGPLKTRWAELGQLNRAEETLVDEWLEMGVPTLEAGCGGGRISQELARRGKGPVTAFDYVPDLVDLARRNDPGGDITFDVADATELPYADNSFAQAVYLQHVLCFVESNGLRQAAFAEAARVVKPGGHIVITLLSAESRNREPMGRMASRYIGAVRALRRGGRSAGLSSQDLPWLRLHDRVNWSFFRDRGPYVHWFTQAEAIRAMQVAGLQLVMARTEATLGQGAGVETAGNERGALTLVARVPGNA